MIGLVASLHEFDQKRTVEPYFSALASGSFTIDGAVPGANAARLEAGLNWAVTSSVSAYGSYIGTFGGAHTASNDIMAGIRVGW